MFTRLAMVLVPLHATPADQPPPLTPTRLLTEWTWEWLMAIGIAIAAGLYIAGLVVLRRRGDRWPIRRSVSFLLGGIGSIALATLSALGTYDTVLLSIHMVQHMILMMVAPMFLALGAPATLALRTLPTRPRAMLLAVLHSRLARVLTFAPLVLALFIATPFALYYSQFYELTLRSGFWHAFLHLHFIIIGCLLMWPLMGIDPVPGRVSYPFRLLILFLMLPFHAFLGISIMSSTELIAEDWYLAFNRTWSPSPLDDQYLAGGILWASGDVIALVMLIALFAQWYASSQREARREDRRLDRLERLQQAAGRPVSPDGEQVRARYDQARAGQAAETDVRGTGTSQVTGDDQ
ncbi:MAG TPA: cytochrome c oxidase assembly protein [Propionibacteriaceae bacterium]|nr:cytochrome c oxidase assembly protein [Propionibacteriaceae bacterium]